MLSGKAGWFQRAVLGGFVSATAVGVVCARAEAAEGSRTENGAYSVEIADNVDLYDAAKNKHIPVKAYYPKEAGKYPVILFVHGAGDSKESAPLLARHWASHGYVSIHATYFWTAEPPKRRSLGRAVDELRRIDRMGPSAWTDRMEEMKFLLGAFGQLEEKVPGLAGKLDGSRVAVAGHSLGAYAVMLMGGAKLFESDGGRVWDFSDPRPRAVLMLSGPGRHKSGLTADSWTGMDRPMMVCAGSYDPPQGVGTGPQWRTESYEYSPPGDKYLVYLDKANHLLYIGPIVDTEDSGNNPGVLSRWARWVLRRAIPRWQMARFECVKAASVAFWDAYLKGDETAKEYLRSGAYERDMRGIAKLSWK